MGIPDTSSPFLGVSLGVSVGLVFLSSVGLGAFSSVSVGLVSLSSEHKIGRSSSMGWANAKLCGLMVVARHDLMFISWCSAIVQSQNLARRGWGPLQTGRCPAPPVLGLVSVSLGVVGLVSLSSLGLVSVSLGAVGLVSLSSEHNQKATAVHKGWQ